jgi:REP element-mobilizing transposase RayT
MMEDSSRHSYKDGPRIAMSPRKTLPHEFPSFVDPAKEIFFVTICCRRRGVNQLTTTKVSAPLLDTIRFRTERGDWYAHLALLMPDHIHFLLSFSRDRVSQTVVSKWKEWTAKTLSLEWQRDFFEHRLRRAESYLEKADYIRQNPVRAGLVEKAEDWPYVIG